MKTTFFYKVWTNIDIYIYYVYKKTWYCFYHELRCIIVSITKKSKLFKSLLLYGWKSLLYKSFIVYKYRYTMLSLISYFFLRIAIQDVFISLKINLIYTSIYMSSNCAFFVLLVRRRQVLTIEQTLSVLILIWLLPLCKLVGRQLLSKE